MNLMSPPSIVIALFAITSALHPVGCNAAFEDSVELSINHAKQVASVQKDYALHRRQKEERAFCSCSPQSYTFQISLDEDCSSSTLSVDGAITDLNCQISSTNSENVRRNRLVDDLLSQIQTSLPQRTQVPTDRTSNTTEMFISSVLFIEFDTSGTLTLINEDTSYFDDANFTEGTMITYPSISQSLDASMRLDEQMQYVPGGAGLFMFGSNSEGEVIFSNRVVWEFSGACDAAVEIGGKTLGWIGFVSSNVYFVDLNCVNTNNFFYRLNTCYCRRT